VAAKNHCITIKISNWRGTMKSFIKQLISHVSVIAKEDVRLFFAPFTGAYKGIKKEYKEIGNAQQLRRKNDWK